MHKVVVLYNTPTEPEHFRSYYVAKHLPLIAQLPGLLASRYSFAIQGPPGPAAPFFCVWEGEFANEGTALAAMGSDVGQRVAGDTANYASGGLTLMHFTPTDGLRK
jgi:uncharacterized protein (TIGR02118 family)